MFNKLKSKVKCYLCNDDGKRFTSCEVCKKLICGDCKSTVFVSGGRTCFWCKSKSCRK